MKTTIELPDDLMRSAKVAAARRRLTLRQLFTQALRKELSGNSVQPEVHFQVDEDGVPYLPARGQRVTRNIVKRLDEETE